MQEKTIAVQIRELHDMSVNELRDKYAEIFGEESRSRNKPSLIKTIAYRIQEAAEGSLSERARRRAKELADEAHIRLRPPPAMPEEFVEATKAQRDDRLPPPGAVLVREFKGVKHEVIVLEEGFRWRGELHSSLSALAREITGTPWNGFRFFQAALKKAKRAAQAAAEEQDA